MNEGVVSIAPPRAAHGAARRHSKVSGAEVHPVNYTEWLYVVVFLTVGRVEGVRVGRMLE
jgi:hypothetical protein